MKRLIAVFTFLLAFSIGAHAQEDRRQAAISAAKADAVKMSEKLHLQPTQQDDFIRLFVTKHMTLDDPNTPAEKKAEMSQVINAKIRASLTPDQIKMMDSDPELKAQLTGSVDTKAKK
jgi:hypothetical protein